MKMKCPCRAVLFAAGLLIGASVPASAQGWFFDAYAGQATYEGVAADVAAANLVLGVRYAGTRDGWFFLSAGSPLAAESPLWAASGVGRRLSFGEGWISAGLDLSAYGHGYRDPSSGSMGVGGSLEALPLIRVARSAATLELHSGLLSSFSSYSGQSRTRALHDSGARLSLGVASPLTLAADARYARADEADYPYAGASASLDVGRGQVWASMGRWFSDSLEELAWSTGVNLQLGQSTTFWGAIRQQPSDPLYWNGSRRSWNVGISRRLGSAPPRAAPIPVQVSDGGVTTIRIPISRAYSAVSIAGDFSGWKPVPMTLSEGFWTVRLPLQPGVYHYAFRSASGEWFVPESTPGRREDGFGGFVAVLVVSEP